MVLCNLVRFMSAWYQLRVIRERWTSLEKNASKRWRYRKEFRTFFSHWFLMWEDPSHHGLGNSWGMGSKQESSTYMASTSAPASSFLPCCVYVLVVLDDELLIRTMNEITISSPCWFWLQYLITAITTIPKISCYQITKFKLFLFVLFFGSVFWFFMYTLFLF